MPSSLFAYNTGSTKTGTLQYGNIAIGLDNLNYSGDAGDVKWWSGPDESLGHVIVTPDPEFGHTSPAGINAGIGFRRSVDLTEESFINVCNHIAGQTFSNSTDASDWLLANNYPTTFPSPSVFHQDTLTYISGLTTPISYRQLLLVNRFVGEILSGLSINSLSEAFDVLYVLGGETAESSLRNLVKRAHDATAVNSPSFTPYEGFLPNGSSSYINSNYNPVTDADNVSINNVSFGKYNRTSAGAAAQRGDGTWDGTQGLRIRSFPNLNYFYAYANDATTNSYTVAGLPLGIQAIRRNGGGKYFTFNKNHSSAIAQDSTSEVSLSIFFGATNTNGVATPLDRLQLSFGFISRFFTNDEMDIIVDACEALMDANGKGVIPETRFIITVKTDNVGTSEDNQFILPTTTGTYDYYVDWGDGGSEEHITSSTSQTHTYSSAGTYQIKIRGTFPRIYFNNVDDKLKLLSIDNWGDIVWGGFINSFWGCTNMIGNYTDTPNLAASVSLSGMFRVCSSFNHSVTNFVTSNVTDISYMLSDCVLFNQPVSSWDTSEVTNMSNLFYNCQAFDQSVSNFNTAKVTNMNGMLRGCLEFNQSVSNFITSEVLDLGNMFRTASKFNQSVNNFDTSKVTSIQRMFYGAPVFNQSLSSWDTSLLQNAESAFHNCYALKQSFSTFKLNSATDITSMLNGCDINETGTTTNYDATLVAWAADPNTPASLTFHGGTSKYSDAGGGKTAKAILTDPGGLNWLITDGGEQI